MSNATATIARTSETPKVVAPTWAGLRTAYQAAEKSGKTAQRKAYDTIVRGYALTEETGTDAKGTVVARSERERGREVIDSLRIESGNVFGLTDVRITQVVKVYQAIALSGVDPFSAVGQARYAHFETIRRNDVAALESVAKQVKGQPDKADSLLADGATASKATAKKRAADKRTADKANAPVVVTVKSLADVTAFATGNLPLVREASATASEEDKAALRTALEAMLAHLS